MLIMATVLVVLLFFAYIRITRIGLGLSIESFGSINRDAWLLVALGLVATTAALIFLFMEFKLSSPVAYIGWVFYLPVLFNVLIPMLILFFSLVGIFYTPWLTLVHIPSFDAIIWGIIVPDESVRVAMDYLGYAFVAIGLLIYTVSLCHMLLHTAKKRTPVTKGLYVIVRHPQYLGIHLWTAGFAILGWRFINYMMWLTLCYSYVLLAENEEVDLTKKFGPEYVQYQDKVPFLVPYPLSIILKPFGFLRRRLRLRLLIYTAFYVLLLLILYYIVYPIVNPYIRRYM